MHIKFDIYLSSQRKAFRVAKVVAGAINSQEEEDAPVYDETPRGFLQGEYGKTASCCHLYGLLKDKKHRRSFVTQLLSAFDDFNEHLDAILYIGKVRRNLSNLYFDNILGSFNF